MNLLDIISLTKAGYKKKDIDELLKVQIDESEEPENDDSTGPENDSEGEPDDSPEDNNVDQDEPSEETDYKKLYDEMKKELDDVKKQLKTAQKNNIRKNMEPETKTPDEAVNDIFRSFM